MIDCIIDYEYIEGPAKEHMRVTGEPMPSGWAIMWCMTATSFHRIFTKEDMKEFLFRLAITLHSMDLVENWIIKDKLMNYSFNGNPYVLTVEDVVAHFGIEVYDVYENYVSREIHLQRVSTGIRDAMFTGVLNGISVIGPRDTGLNKKEISGERYTPEITPELVKKAEFFASDLMKFMPDKMFTERNPAILRKEKELDERGEHMKHLPVFDIKKIPPEIIRKCLLVMYPEDYVDYLFSEREDFDKFAKPMIYLAWLYANDFMVSDGNLSWPREGFSINYDDYELESGGINLLVTIQDYNLKDTVPLLKGLLIE